MGSRLADSGKHLEALGGAGQQRIAAVRGQIAQLSPEDLTGDPKRQVVLELRSGGAQHSQAARPTFVQRCLVNPGLAHSSVALEQQRSADVALGVVQDGADGAQRRVPIEKPRTPALGASASISSLPNRHGISIPLKAVF